MRFADMMGMDRRKSESGRRAQRVQLTFLDLKLHNDEEA